MIIDFYGRGGGGPTPSDVYTKEEVNALIADFITATTDDLVNYYLKSETYTRSEIEALVGQITSFEVVATLPVSDIKTNVIYLLGPIGSGADRYEEYIYSNNAWVKIGETSIDLSNYVTVNTLNTALSFYTTTFDLNLLLQGKQDTLTAGAGITIGTDGTISADSNVISMTQAQYDALGTNVDPDKIYIITDATPVTLATVATSGSYNDLTDKPTIPVVPTLATVATTGAYSDLTGTPTIPTVGTGTVTLTSGGATIGTFGLNDSNDKTIDIPAGGGGNAWYGSQAEFDALGTNIELGYNYYINEINWSDISNRPTIPTVPQSIKAFSNTAEYVTKSQMEAYINDKKVMDIVNSHNVYLTQAEYNQLGTNVDPDTNYHIEGDEQTITLVFTLDGIGTVAYDIYAAPVQ